MSDVELFMAHPAVQAALAPFALALVVALWLRGAWQVLALGAALLVAASLSVGFSLESMTATRKMVLVVLAAAGLWPIVGLLLQSSRWWHRSTIFAVFSAVGTLWVFERLLLQMPSMKGLAVATVSIVYVVALMLSAGAMPREGVRSAVAAVWLPLGAGALAVLGSSAVLGQIGIAVGTGAGAVLLERLARGQGRDTATALWVAEVAAVAAGLIGLLATLTGDLSWWALLPLIAVPWVLHWPVLAHIAPAWRRGAMAGLVAGVPVVAAGVMAWVSTR
ncbi:hypothetical protein [Variovorax terrae]|uniref:Uncharacterized protein n=1 Tax=Variovorax terrae TaxID=2923278 RepID=A0A9X1VPV1_9BURK|nr:hypothetical protein [Variovorax terrae]MCJ0761606.1 hypothetical protein [Variovorax terrae]